MRILRIFGNSFRSQFWIFSRPSVYVILISFFTTEYIVLRSLGFYPGPDYFAGAFLPPPISQFRSLAIVAVMNISGFDPLKYGIAVVTAFLFSILFNSLIAAIFQISYPYAKNEIQCSERIFIYGQYFKQIAINFLYILAAFVIGGSIYFGIIAFTGALSIAGPVTAIAGVIVSTVSMPVIMILMHVPITVSLAFRNMKVRTLFKIIKKSWYRMLLFSSIFIIAVIISKTLFVNIICSPIGLTHIIWLKWAIFFTATFLLMLLSTIQSFFIILFSRNITQVLFEKNSIDIS